LTVEEYGNYSVRNIYRTPHRSGFT